MAETNEDAEASVNKNRNEWRYIRHYGYGHYKKTKETDI